MRKIILMTSAVVLFPLSTVAQTTCTSSPDCESLGYTESSCPNGGVKCPWGDKWACLTDAEMVCADNGFLYSCVGTGYSAGSGDSCENKYKSCKCTSPYTWSGTACSCPTKYKYTCTGTGYSGGNGTDCDNKYAKCNCSSNYIWSSGKCKSNCSSSYQYSCTGAYESPVGTACGGKYTSCSCSSPYTWSSGDCVCSSSYKYSCTGANEDGGSGSSCGGKYRSCKCKSGYYWDDCHDSCIAGTRPSGGSQCGYPNVPEV